MNINIKLMTAVTFVGALSVSTAVVAETNEQTVTANVVSTISIQRDTDLQFPDIILDGSSDPSYPSDQSAEYTLTGNAGEAYTFNMDSSSDQLTSSDSVPPGAQMPITFAGTSTSDASASSGSLGGATGTDTITVTGSLTYLAAQPEGTYEGELVLTVDYD